MPKGGNGVPKKKGKRKKETKPRAPGGGRKSLGGGLSGDSPNMVIRCPNNDRYKLAAIEVGLTLSEWVRKTLDDAL